MANLVGVTQVLELFVKGHTALRVSTLVESLDWPKSTSSRVLADMAQAGLLQRDATTRQYTLGSLITALAQAQRQTRAPLQHLCHNALAMLCGRTGHAAHLSVLNGNQTVLLEHFAGVNPLQVVSPVGSRLPAGVTAMGRALLSRLTCETFDALYRHDENKLKDAPRNSPQTVSALRALVWNARRQRHSVAIDEGLPGVGAVATSVCDPLEPASPIGLAVSFPAQQVGAAELAALRADLLATTRDVGRQVGDPWWLLDTATQPERTESRA